MRASARCTRVGRRQGPASSAPAIRPSPGPAAAPPTDSERLGRVPWRRQQCKEDPGVDTGRRFCWHHCLRWQQRLRLRLGLQLEQQRKPGQGQRMGGGPAVANRPHPGCGLSAQPPGATCDQADRRANARRPRTAPLHVALNPRRGDGRRRDRPRLQSTDRLIQWILRAGI